MENKILLDENKHYSFDFSALEYVWDMHSMAEKTTILRDVDFITQTDKEVLFIEYKNASIKGAKNPDGMMEKIKAQTFYEKIARKYYDSLFLFWACNGNVKEMPITYILLIEHPAIDKRIRKMLEVSIKKQLPFELKDERIARTIISKFQVINLEEWQEKFPQIAIIPVQKVDL